ncbi:MAG: hypothetical protein JST86_21215 [Bacteroidetes bacterium]|nr:hypothetical protein [Bacteroidota bacterium]
MDHENIGGFFSYEDMHDDTGQENWKPVNQFGKALYKKSVDILNVTQTICDMLPDDDHAQDTKGFMMQNALLVSAKIAGARSMEYYSLQMESAVIIKVNICQLREQTWACLSFHNMEQQYVDVLRNEIEAFRKIFVDWVKAFDKSHDLPDEWHLFNDPTTFPEDDEPFNPDAFFEDFDPDEE